jgi:hypothetical protein
MEKEPIKKYVDEDNWTGTEELSWIIDVFPSFLKANAWGISMIFVSSVWPFSLITGAIYQGGNKNHTTIIKT